MTGNEQLKRALMLARTLGRIGPDDILASIGLQRRVSLLSQILPAAGAFTAGVAIGAGVGLLLAPQSGQELRDSILDRAQRVSDALNQRVTRMTEVRRGAAERMREGADRIEEGLGEPSRTHA